MPAREPTFRHKVAMPKTAVKRKLAQSSSDKRMAKPPKSKVKARPSNQGGQTPVTISTDRVINFKRECQKKWRQQRKGNKPSSGFVNFCTHWRQVNSEQLPRLPGDQMQTMSQAWWNLSESDRDEWRKEAQEALRVWQLQQPEEEGDKQQAPPSTVFNGKGDQTPNGKGGQTPAEPPQGSPKDEKAVCITMGDYWVDSSASQVIGKGSFGCVYRALHKKTQQFVAAKVFHDQGDRQTISREIEIYERIAAMDKHAPFADMLWSNRDHSGMKAVVLDMFDGDLHSWLCRNEADETLLKSMCLQTCLALHHLHEDMKFVHLDIKPANLLWRGVDSKIALVDFGMAEPILAPKPLHSVYCTPNYRPPELWRCAPGGKTPGKLLQPSVDVWSFGCTCWQMMTGELLFQGRQEKDIETQIMQFSAAYGHASWGPWQVRLAKAGRWAGFIKQCLHPNPAARPKELRANFTVA